MARPPIHLIVNADDYGYAPSISRGILAGAAKGAITATGILANSPMLNEQLSWLKAADALDLGVHLNLSWGEPLTPALAQQLSAFEYRFPSITTTLNLLLTRKLSSDLIRQEWYAQIESCQAAGKALQFLNGHEHIHMLPNLFSIALDCAKMFNIPYIRLTRPDWSVWGLSPALRNGLIFGMYSLNKWRMNKAMPIFIGLGKSGQLNLAYLEKLFATLQPGKSYELMCHPGHFPGGEVSDPKLLAYHHWAEELDLLESPAFKDLYSTFGIHLRTYAAHP